MTRTFLILILSYIILSYTMNSINLYSISTLVFLLMFYTYPISILIMFVSLLVTFYRSSSFKQKINSKPPLTPKNGDILLFTTNYNLFNKKISSYANFSKIILWDGTFFSLPKYPITHIGIMINDHQYIDSFIPYNKKYDILTNTKKDGPGLRNIKNIRKNWSKNKGDIAVLKTNFTFDAQEQTQIKNEIKGAYYTDYFGCSGLVNYVLKKHNKIKNSHTNLFPSDFIKYGKQIGKLQ